MSLTSNNISATVVRDILGENTLNIKQLCRSDKINMWSPWKPIVRPPKYKNTPLTYNIVKELGSGLGMFGDRIFNNVTEFWNSYFNGTLATFVYEKPETDFHLGDFRYYDHESKPKFADIEPTYYSTYYRYSNNQTNTSQYLDAVNIDSDPQEIDTYTYKVIRDYANEQGVIYEDLTIYPFWSSYYKKDEGKMYYGLVCWAEGDIIEDGSTQHVELDPLFLIPVNTVKWNNCRYDETIPGVPLTGMINLNHDKCTITLSNIPDCYYPNVKYNLSISRNGIIYYSGSKTINISSLTSQIVFDINNINYSPLSYTIDVTVQNHPIANANGNYNVQTPL